MTGKEFEKVYDYLNKKMGRFSKGLEMSEIALSKLNMKMSFNDAIKKIDYVFYTEYRNQRNDEYYKPLRMYVKDLNGCWNDFDPSERNRIHTAYGKDISSKCLGCGRRYIKNGKWQKYCTPQCRKRSIYKNISKL